MSDLPKLKNSSYAKGRKYIVDAEQLNDLFEMVADGTGTTSLRDIIEATGQAYNPLVSTQLLDAITQLILAANYFQDVGTPNNIVLDAYTPGYGVPTQYIEGMVVTFVAANRNSTDTTILFNGLSSAVPLLTDTYSQLSPGMILPDVVYTAKYDSSHGGFILSSTAENSGSQALVDIRKLIESTGITYSAALEQQLSQAVAMYALQQSYECVSTESQIQANNYVLKPYGEFSQIPVYTDGMIIRFRPTFNNTLITPTIQIYGNTRCSLLLSDGNTLPVNSLTTNFDAVVRYENGTFYLVSNCLSSLNLQNGPVITTISDDVSLSQASNAAVPTEYAVKSYVDAKSTSVRRYAVSSGKIDTNGRADFLEITSPTAINILAGVTGAATYETMVDLSNAVASPNRASEQVPEDPDDPESPLETITYDLANCFDGNNDTYYETLDTGSIVAGDPDNLHPYEYITWPNFIAATGLDYDVTRFRILGESSDTTPRSVFFMYSVDGLPIYVDDGSGNMIPNPNKQWQYVGTQTYEEADAQGRLVTKVLRDEYPVSFESGKFTDIDVNIVPYVDATNPDLGTLYDYDVKCCANEFHNSERGWQVIQYEFCKNSDEDIPPLVLTYDDGETEVITEKVAISTDGITEESAVIIKNQHGAFEVINASAYTESMIEPTPVTSHYWAQIKNNAVETYKYDEQEDDDTPPNTYIVKTRQKFVKVGTIELTNVGTVAEPVYEITTVHPAAFNGEYTALRLTLSDGITVNHNIGSVNTAKMFITCMQAQGNYDIGDTVELTTQAISIDLANAISASTTVSSTSITISPLSIGGVDYPISYSPNPHDHTATTTLTAGTYVPAYRVISSGYTSAKLKFNTILLPNKNDGTLFAIDPSKWVVSVYCSRSF